MSGVRQQAEAELTEWLLLLETRHSQEIQLGLDRVKKAAEILGLLKPQPTIITVAGTNGKGSTAALLEAIYCDAGYRTASYSSPHLIKFNERIKVNRQAIASADLIAAFALIEQARGSIPLTYFEVTTLAALWFFKQHELDVIILETGMGGRLDAVNIIDADLAIITTVALDHQQFLGNTINQIGAEKAGILRADKPFIYADDSPPVSITTAANSLPTINYFKNQHYHYQLNNDEMIFKHAALQLVLPRCHFHPNSIAAALMAVICLQSTLPIDAAKLPASISKTVLAGRMQIINTRPQTLIDVAHNPQAVNYLARQLKNNFLSVNIHAVFSALADKDIIGLIAPLKPLVAYWYPTLLPGKRAAPAEQLLTALADNGIVCPFCYTKPLMAYQAACKNAAAGDLIIVYGSFILAGDVLSCLS